MRESLITRKDSDVGEGVFDSIKWAFSEHVKSSDTGEFNSAVMYGNEDSPAMIDFYTQAEPLVTDKVAWRWVREE